MKTYSAVGDGMKGYVTRDGVVIAWEADGGGNPHHDEVSGFYGDDYVARMSFSIHNNEMYVDTMEPLFSHITQSAARSFTGYPKDTVLLIKSGTGRLKTTLDGYFALMRNAPDSDDYEYGEDDEEYRRDTGEYIDRINSVKTVSELLGRVKSPEFSDDPRIHLALNPALQVYAGFDEQDYTDIGLPTLGPWVANNPQYRVHFYDGWHGRRDSRETVAATPERARSNVRARLADERGLHPSQLPRDQYEFRQIEQIGDNPPWADKAIRTSWESMKAVLVSRGVPVEWLPVRPLHELGCGSYGCVYSTEDPKTVFKITTDVSEAKFVANYLTLRGRSIYSLGVVQYYGIIALPFKYRKRPMYALWREEIGSVGCPSVEDNLRRMWETKPESSAQYEHREWNDFIKQLMSFKDHAHWARTISVDRRRRMGGDEYWTWMAGQIEHSRDTNDLSEREVMSAKTSGSRYPYKFGLFLRMCEMMSQEMGSSYFGVNVGNALETYLDAGLLLADVHCGNIGMYSGEEIDMRQLYAPIITDPGHAVIMSEELDNPSIEMVSL